MSAIFSIELFTSAEIFVTVYLCNYNNLQYYLSEKKNKQKRVVIIFYVEFCVFQAGLAKIADRYDDTWQDHGQQSGELNIMFVHM